jgi:hypothetical protein
VSIWCRFGVNLVLIWCQSGCQSGVNPVSINMFAVAHTDQGSIVIDYHQPWLRVCTQVLHTHFTRACRVESRQGALVRSAVFCAAFISVLSPQSSVRSPRQSSSVLVSPPFRLKHPTVLVPNRRPSLFHIHLPLQPLNLAAYSHSPIQHTIYPNILFSPPSSSELAALRPSDKASGPLNLHSHRRCAT